MFLVKIALSIIFLYLSLGLLFVSEILPEEIEDIIFDILEIIKKLALVFCVIALACAIVVIWFVPKGVLYG